MDTELDIKTKPKTFLEEQIGNMFLDICLGNSFLDWPQKHSNKNKSKQVGPQQNNKFCTAKKKKEKATDRWY